MDPALLYWLLRTGYSTIEETPVDDERRDEGLRVQKKQNINLIGVIGWSALLKESEEGSDISTQRLIGKNTRIGVTVRDSLFLPSICSVEALTYKLIALSVFDDLTDCS